MLKKYKPTRSISYERKGKIIQLKKQTVDNWLWIVLLRILIFLVAVVLFIWLLINVLPLTFPILILLIVWHFRNRPKDNLTETDEIRITQVSVSKLVQDDKKFHFHDLLKFPRRNYFELVLLPNDEILTISFMTFSRRIATFKIEKEDLIFFVEKLEQILQVEIYETYQTRKGEEVICFRSRTEIHEKQPFLHKITKNKQRLFIKPYSSSDDFIINFQRNILHTYEGVNHNLDYIQKINYDVVLYDIILKAHSKYDSFEIIRFSKGQFSMSTIQEDMQKLFDYLETIPQLQHVEFDVS